MKKIFCLIFIFLLMFFMCGCDDNNTDSSKKSDTEIKENTSNTDDLDNNTGTITSSNESTNINDNYINQPSDNNSEKKVDNKATTSPESKKEPTKPSTSTSKKETIPATKEYYCTNGFTLSGTHCVKIFSADAISGYSCDVGTLRGNECEITNTISISNYSSYSREVCQTYYGSGHYESCLCRENGGTYESGKGCYKMTTTRKPATLTYYCTEGLELRGTKCEKDYVTDALLKYTCPSGYTSYGYDCVKQ